MSRDDPSPESQVLGYLRHKTSWTQAGLEKSAGLKKGMVSAYESGHRSPGRPILERLCSVLGFGPADVDLALERFRIPFRAPVAEAPEGERRPWGLDDGDLQRCRAQGSHFGLVSAQSFALRFTADLSAQRLRLARQEADSLFRHLLALPESKQRLAVERDPVYQTWLVVERICEASERAAAKDPKRALALAHLAQRAAEGSPAPEAERCRMRGYAWIFVGNALRVGSDLRKADEAFAAAERLWKRGEGASGVLLEEWRLPDMLASLRRDQRRWEAAVSLHAAALGSAPPLARGRILLKQAFAFEQMGDCQEALRVLREAAPWVESVGDPRQRVVLRFNLVVNLLHLGYLKEAERLLPEIRGLAVEQRHELDLLRLQWLEGRVAGENGRLDEAIQTLRRVRYDFTAREIAYDAALAGLEESVFLLESLDFAQARRVAEETLWVFQSRQVHEEGLKSLQVLHEALRGEVATAQLARQVRDRFRLAH